MNWRPFELSSEPCFRFSKIKSGERSLTRWTESCDNTIRGWMVVEIFFPIVFLNWISEEKQVIPSVEDFMCSDMSDTIVPRREVISETTGSKSRRFRMLWKEGAASLWPSRMYWKALRMLKMWLANLRRLDVSLRSRQ